MSSRPFTIDLSGCTAWVTGAGRGIGLACAERLAGCGARVVGLDLEPTPELERVAATVRAVDIGDGPALDGVLEGLLDEGFAPDIVISNAGIARDAAIWKLADDDWDRVIAVNLTGAYRLVRRAIPAMRAAGRGGSIVCIGSINGLRGKFGQSAYASAKAGLHGLVRTVAKEVARFGIRANAVLPGLVDTEMTRALPEEARARALDASLLGRPIEPGEIADTVLFLASPLSGPITGALVPVDGGQSIA